MIILAMLSGVDIARRVMAPLSRILSRKKWPEQPCPYSTSEAVFKEAKKTTTMAYAVRRCDPELIGPASYTPRKTKLLSDLDAIPRPHTSLAFFYRGAEAGVDPAGVIRHAVGKALVHYYPLAGRLREIEEGRKLVVDCTGEGLLFVQAEADVQLADLEAAGLRPPLPCWDQLLYDVEGSSGVLNSPLMLIQVTRLLCGGFVFALRFNHTMCDGIGIAQFLNAVAEHARGLPSPTTTPTWAREQLHQARHPHILPLPSSFPWLEFDDLLPPPPPVEDIVTRCFTFSASDVSAIKQSLRVPATTFEALAAFLWRARAAALELSPGDDAPLGIAVNFRSATGMSLPAGYYGNASIPSAVVVKAAALHNGSLGDTVELVRLAKATVTTQYVRATLHRRWLMPPNMFLISDARRLGFDHVDFGWGKPVFAGPVDALFGVSFFVAAKDRHGKAAIAVPVALPRLAMDRFASLVDRLFVVSSI